MMTSLEQKLDALSKQNDLLRRDIRRLIKLFEARDPNRSMTIDEFCTAENMSRATYDRLEHRPDVFFIATIGEKKNAGRKTPRISPEARIRWRQEREREAREAREAEAAMAAE
jgi:hypothetical protein